MPAVVLVLRLSVGIGKKHSDRDQYQSAHKLGTTATLATNVPHLLECPIFSMQKEGNVFI